MRLFTANPDDTERLSLALDRAGIATTTHIVGNGAQCWVEAHCAPDDPALRKVVKRHRKSYCISR